MEIISNKKYGTAILHFTETETVTLVGNTSTSAIALEGEDITGASIRRIWGSNSVSDSYWKVKRGDDLIATISTSVHLDFSGSASSINIGKDEPLTVELEGGDGFIMIDIGKEVIPTDSQYFN